MMGDLKKRASFARLVNYVNNPKKARLIDSKDVRLDNNATIANSMQGQADDKPGRKLKNPVYHISLDFAHEDTPKLTDNLMAEIAREYMRRMGIKNTQYIVCRHTDREHQHLHIVANRVDNNGNTISDSNDDVRNVAVCKALTREYGLHFSKGKVNVKRDRLRGKDKVKYQIYDAVKATLPH
ncbi:relaxase/mobilization nuclease domain-containing protein, partial [Phocaeicola vulgatus]